MKFYLKIEKIAPVVIILSVLLLTFESIFHTKKGLNDLLFILDLAVLIFFVVEMIFRTFYFPFNISEVVVSMKHVFFKNTLSEEEQKNSQIVKKYELFLSKCGIKDDEVINYDYVNKVCLELLFWLIFDIAITISSVAAIFFIHLFQHPEVVTLFRVIRVFRIIRIFEVHKSLKQTERKIMSVIPTVMVFAVLLALIHFVYAIIGCNLYNFTKFNDVDFSNLYNAYFGLFRSLTNGWSSMHADLLTSNVPRIVTDLYCISFFVFSSMITLNVFLAVMTTQIQDRLNEEEIASNDKDKQFVELIEKLNHKIDRLESKLNNEKDK